MVQLSKEEKVAEPEVAFKAYYCGAEKCPVCDRPSVHLERALKQAQNPLQDIFRSEDEMDNIITAVHEMKQECHKEGLEAFVKQLTEGNARAENIVDALEYYDNVMQFYMRQEKNQPLEEKWVNLLEEGQEYVNYFETVDPRMPLSEDETL